MEQCNWFAELVLGENETGTIKHWYSLFGLLLVSLINNTFEKIHPNHYAHRNKSDVTSPVFVHWQEAVTTGRKLGTFIREGTHKTETFARRQLKNHGFSFLKKK